MQHYLQYNAYDKMETKNKKKITLTHYHYNVYTLYIALLPCFNYYNIILLYRNKGENHGHTGRAVIKYTITRWQIWGGAGGKGTA